MTNITEFPSGPKRDLIAEMTGPKNTGNAVIIDGRRVPNLTMHDRGDEVEFVLDQRLCFIFPKEEAWNAAAFAFAAMAIGAGFASPAGLHLSQRPFGPEVVRVGEIPQQ